MNNNSKHSILIVDDNPTNIEVLGSSLINEFEVMAATCGQQALEIVKSSNIPDLILLDIMMPEMDGYEVCRKLKSDSDTQAIPIIFVSAKNETEDEAFGLELGAIDYLRKPVNSAIALARIKSQLDLKRYRDQLEQDLQTSEFARVKHQRNFYQLFSNSPQAIAFIGQNQNILEINPRFETLFEVKSDDIILTNIDHLIVPREKLPEHRRFIQNILQGNTSNIETVRNTKSGTSIPVSMIGYPVKIDSEAQGIFIIYEDISQRKIFEEQLRYQAFHDALTGIPNRVLLHERVERAMARSKRVPSYNFAVLLIDLDRFKNINDSLGHQAGDSLLRTVSERIKTSIRTMDTVARLGGDEFAVLVEDFKDIEEVTAIIQRIQKNVEEPISISNNKVHISSSIGVVIDTHSYEKPQDVFRDADLAMYHAKENGKANFKYFDTGMYERAVVSQQLETDLRYAVDRDELELYYQPIISVQTGDLQGFEALIRWNHAQHGRISPDRFIPLAEETGLIVPIGQWIFKEACQQLKTWQSSYDNQFPFTMNINISVKQFLHHDLVQNIEKILHNLDLNPEFIKLELTESLLMEHSNNASEKIRGLKELGMKLVIDDFGTGYSSLSYIHQFPIDVLKIDRSFVKNLELGTENMEIVKTIIALSKNLGMTVVAEGVENDFQLKTLKEMGCENAQGYLFSKPLQKGQVPGYLDEK